MKAFFGRLWDNEPVAIINAIRLTFLAAGVFGLSLTETQLFALMAALEGWFTLFVRKQVTPDAKKFDLISGDRASIQDRGKDEPK